MPLPVLVVAVLLTVAALALQGTRGSGSGSETVSAAGPQLAAYSVNAREVAIDQAEAAQVPLTDGVVAGASGVVAPPSSAAPAQELAAPATVAVKVAAPPTSAKPVAATTATTAAATTAAATTAAPITAETTTTVAEPTTTVAPATSVADLALPPAGAQSLGEFTVVCYVIVGTTYSGEPTGPNVVAVDKSVIPLHTNLWIDGGVGYRTALDIGGGVKGNTLDLWMTWPDCKKFGKQHLSVYKVG